MKTVSTNS